jgi:hypothetical protein
MNSRHRRLKIIELALTPRQTVLMWLREATNGTFGEGARHTFPRSVIANSVLKNVTNAMKREPDAVVERAVRQARQEADMLYNLAISVNDRVLASTSERIREFEFLAQYLRGVTSINLGPHSEEEIRRTALLFVEEVFLLDGAVSQVCAEQFGGQSILFSDLVERLEHQLDLANTALECFNVLADKLNFNELTEKSVRERLEADVATQHSVWRDLARLKTLADFGDAADYRAAYSRLSRELHDWRDRHAQARDEEGGFFDCAR